ncbi:MAG: transglycosylase SLT domain-containing protein [Bryobacteraceae bacterium]|nr:transglycosylase SLT domain-containing protein [Bryobacteraceae bacterium]
MTKRAWLLFLAIPLVAQPLAPLGRAYRFAPSPTTRAALEHHAKARAAGPEGPLAWLALGAGDLAARNHAGAAEAFRKAAPKLPVLADAIAYHEAAALYELKQYAAVPATLAPVWKQTPQSPHFFQSIVLAAKAERDAGNPGDSVRLLERHLRELPRPKVDFELAVSYEAATEPVKAAAAYQRVYYGYPLSEEAALAEPAIKRLVSTLGAQYPPPLSKSLLNRALLLLSARQWTRARHELEALTSQLTGPELDLARVRIGVADANAGRTPSAFFYLRSLKVQDSDADAERLHYVVVTARRMKNWGAMRSAMEDLARSHSTSPWRLEALIHAANEYVVSNDFANSAPLLRACAESFPKDPKSAYCHWKLAWNRYGSRADDSAEMLEEHIRRYPASDNVSAAWYFLGRLREARQDFASAKAIYEFIDHRYPNYYYAVQARERLQDPALRRIKAGPPPEQTIASPAVPPAAAEPAFRPSPDSKVRVERARLLASAGLDDWAEFELRFGAQRKQDAPAIALELASLARERGAHDVAIRWLKRYVPNYLRMPLESAPDDFWRMAFPLAYRSELENFSRQNSLDPYLVAALIRQESEFNPRAVSVAKAYGLTQVLPSTGRELSRAVGVRPFRPDMLFVPAVNLKLGTYYLKRLVGELGGHWEAALASYNAGKSRAVEWLTWGDFREPAEFIETIPFTETREYVQIVLRNADVYRRLYGRPAARNSH